MQRDGPPRPSVCQMTGRIKCKKKKKKKKKKNNLKTKQHLAMHKARAALRLNIPGRRQLKKLLAIEERG